MSSLGHWFARLRLPVWLCLMLPFLVAPQSNASDALRVPQGFSIEQVSGTEIRFPMFATLDDRGRLYVTESSGQDLYMELQKQVKSCRISRLENPDAHGRYQVRKTFAEGLVPSMGLAWHQGKLYAADPPDLVALEDTDGDGRADVRTVILTGFGHTDNGSLHGLTFGPDGWLYCTTGQPDGYRFKKADGSVLEGRSGALIRCRPDGSDVEVVARGFENLIEVVFLPSGEIVGTDNWFQLPNDGIRDALVHLVEGGLYPRDADRGTPQPVTGRLLPPMALYPAVAFSGLALYHGPGFPASMRGHVFSAQHNTRKIVRHALQRVGSSFQPKDEDFVWTEDPDFHPSDVLEDADGSLLVVDTGSWYVHHCPTGRIRRSPALGGIHRVRWTGAASVQGETVSVTQASDDLAAEIRAAARIGDRRMASRLPSLLTHDAPQVQLAAAEAFARCGTVKELPALMARLAEPADPLMEHALIHALFRVGTLRHLEQALGHPSPRVQRAALVLLDQPPHNALKAEALTARLFASDASLREVAHAGLRRHPEWAELAVPLMEELLTHKEPTLSELESLQAYVEAFSLRPPIVALVSRGVAAETGVAETLRVALLSSLAKTSGDRLPGPWRDAVGLALRSSSVAVRIAAMRVVSSLRLEGVDAALRALAVDTALSRSLRVQALKARAGLRLELNEAEFALVEAQLMRTNPAQHRLAAVEVLAVATLQPEQFLRFVKAVTKDPLVSPHQVLGALPSRRLDPAGSDVLLQYLRSMLKAGWQMTEGQMRRIGNAIPEERAPMLESLRQIASQSAQHRLEQLTALEPLLQGGSSERGRGIFREKVSCTSCHRVRGNGGIVGPDLTHIGSIRSGRDLIESLVMPSATFAQGYETYAVTLASGDRISGVRVRQADDSLVLRDSSGTETRVPDSLGARMERQTLSLMPEGLLQGLSAGEIRDLLAFLQSLR